MLRVTVQELRGQESGPLYSKDCVWLEKRDFVFVVVDFFSQRNSIDSEIKMDTNQKIDEKSVAYKVVCAC